MYLQNLTLSFMKMIWERSFCFASKTTNVFTEPYSLFHENDLGAFLLFCIKCYVSEANQAMNQKVR